MKENIISEPNQEIFDFHHLVVFLSKVNLKHTEIWQKYTHLSLSVLMMSLTCITVT